MKELSDLNNTREELAALAKAWYDNRDNPAGKLAGEKLLEEKLLELREKENLFKKATELVQKENEAWDNWKDSLLKKS